MIYDVVVVFLDRARQKGKANEACSSTKASVVQLFTPTFMVPE
jgi:hypothetical protein